MYLSDVRSPPAVDNFRGLEVVDSLAKLLVSCLPMRSTAEPVSAIQLIDLSLMDGRAGRMPSWLKLGHPTMLAGQASSSAGSLMVCQRLVLLASLWMKVQLSPKEHFPILKYLQSTVLYLEGSGAAFACSLAVLGVSGSAGTGPLPLPGVMC